MEEDAIFIAYTAIIAMAMVPIYFGSYLSLHVDKEDREDAMTSKDAAMFPIIGSAVLFGLYMLFKTFSPEMINMLLSAYFLILGFLSLNKTLTPFFQPFLFSLDHFKLPELTIPAIPYVSEKPVHIRSSLMNVAIWCVSAAVIYAYITTKHWLLNNLLGLSFSVQGVALFNLGSYWNGCILLGGLFIYDIFWVFGTDVMVTVAKSFDAPIKLLFPRDIFAEKYAFSMLGLGDIVIPGVFIALLLRYDFHRSGQTCKKTQHWPATYFKATFLGYFVGLFTTIFVMHTFKHAQPALLYLVPTCLGFSFITAVFQNDIKGLVAYTEEEEPAKPEPKTE